MVQSRSVLGSNVPLGSAPCVCRHLDMYRTGMRKVILDLDAFAEEFHTDFASMAAAYAAADVAAQFSAPFTVATSQTPKLRGGRYEVETKPLGYPASCTNEQVSMMASRHSLLLTFLLVMPACLPVGEADYMLCTPTVHTSPELVLCLSAECAGTGMCLLQSCTGPA